MVNMEPKGLRPFADAQRVRQELTRRLPRVAKVRGCSMSMLRALDDAYRAADELSESSAQDAAIMAKALLGVLQRLAWVQLSGKVDASPEPQTVPLKLWNRGAVSQAARQQLDRANALAPTKANAQPLLVACKLLVVWIADDNAAPLFADGEDVLTVKVNAAAPGLSTIAAIRRHAMVEGWTEREAAGTQGPEAAGEDEIAQAAEVTA